MPEKTARFCEEGKVQHAQGAQARLLHCRQPPVAPVKGHCEGAVVRGQAVVLGPRQFLTPVAQEVAGRDLKAPVIFPCQQRDRQRVSLGGSGHLPRQVAPIPPLVGGARAVVQEEGGGGIHIQTGQGPVGFGEHPLPRQLRGMLAAGQ
ncbi:MAG: hypothetical protein JXA33_10100 [Anaerolineae bacterium]|nr:hypothetical protein [Anaerolineae bacterium]